MNPAVLSADLKNLFPQGVAAAELYGAGDASLLLPAEAACVGQAALSRIQEFAAGRACARLALAQFGIRDFPLAVRGDRQPAWPAAVVGSITHTAGLCAAVVGETACFLGLGLDSEGAGEVKPDLWPKICVPHEIAWLRALPAAEQAAAAALIFAAKEAFYKCQYPSTGEFLSFQDIRIAIAEFSPQRSAFEVHALRDLAVAGATAFPVQGQYRFHGPFVSAGVALVRPAT